MIDITSLDEQIAMLEAEHTRLYSQISELRHEREQILCQEEPHQFRIDQQVRVRADYRAGRDVNAFIQAGETVRITAFVPLRRLGQEAYLVQSGHAGGYMMARDLESVESDTPQS